MKTGCTLRTEAPSILPRKDRSDSASRVDWLWAVEILCTSAFFTLFDQSLQ